MNTADAAVTPLTIEEYLERVAPAELDGYRMAWLASVLDGVLKRAAG
jgi:hypothetical protein